MERRIVVMKLICSLGHCECDGHTVHKLSQRRLTADWLAPRESDCSRMHSKVSPDWLLSYIKATRSVFEIFKMVGYLLDRPRKYLRRFESSRSMALCQLVVKGVPLDTATSIFRVWAQHWSELLLTSVNMRVVQKLKTFCQPAYCWHNASNASRD
jgi:hypothetical protein